jgi:hypothetical protein
VKSQKWPRTDVVPQRDYVGQERHRRRKKSRRQKAFTEEHKGHKEQNSTGLYQDLSVFATFVSFCWFCFAFVAFCWTIRTDPASMRLHGLPKRHG